MLSNFGSRLLAFFLVPLYTTVLSTSEYGNYDIIYSAIILIFPILTLDITEGAMRFLLDKNSSKEKICKSSFGFLNTSIAIVSLFIILNSIFHFFSFIEQYSVLIILYYITYAYNLSVQNIARGLNKIKDIGISGVINTILMLCLNIIFLLVFRWGLNGYFLANIFAGTISALYLLIRTKVGRYAISFGRSKNKITREVMKYSAPLTLNSLSWWINDVSDRYIVTLLCGAAANGVYSVAYKIPSILSVVQSIFNQAWLISVTKEYKINSNTVFVKKVYKFYNSALIVLCSTLITLNKPIASILYKNEFYNAWQYVPFLLISVIFAALSGAIATIFSAEKNTKISALTSFISAATNIVLNLILIPSIGVVGAAIATAVSNFIAWLVRWIYCQRYIKLKISITDILSYIIVIVQAISFMLLPDTILYPIEGVSVIIILALNINVFKKMRIIY